VPRGRKKVEKEVGPQSAMIRGGIYLTVEGYRRLIGVASKQIIFSALRSDRIVGAVQIGNTWIIPRDAIMLEPKNITHGVEGYRRLIGVASKQIIFSALRSDRIVGAILLGNTWIIPRDAIMLEPKNITHGGYRELRRIKEEYARKTQQILEEKEARAHNRKRDIV